jgi:hypothetical protein
MRVRRGAMEMARCAVGGETEALAMAMPECPYDVEKKANGTQTNDEGWNCNILVCRASIPTLLD